MSTTPHLDPGKYPPVMFLEEVAEATRVPLSTLRYWIQNGTLKTGKIGRRRVMRREDVDALIESAFAGGS